MNHIEDISNYFATDAAERNAQAFEERIKTDTIFAQEVANYLAQQNAIRKSRRNRVTDADRQALATRLQEYEQTTKKPSFFVVYKKQFSMAAAILLFVAGWYWINRLNDVEIKPGPMAGKDTTQNARILPDTIKIDSLKNK